MKVVFPCELDRTENNPGGTPLCVPKTISRESGGRRAALPPSGYDPADCQLERGLRMSSAVCSVSLRWCRNPVFSLPVQTQGQQTL